VTKSTYLALVGALVSLVGCASTPSDVRSSAYRSSFVVERNYQATYRSLLERQQACEQANFIASQTLVEGQLYTDIQSGTITSAIHVPLYTQTTAVLDIKAMGEKSSEVTLTTQYDVVAKYVSRLQKWLAGSRECS